MQRVCFRLKVRKEMMDEYVVRHASVWPEMLNALSETGWHNYSLHLDRSDGTLIGYFETPSLKDAKAGMEKKRDQCKVAGRYGAIFCCLRWQAT